MRKHALVAHLLLSLAILPLAFLNSTPQYLAGLCLIDIALLGYIVLDEGYHRRLNLLAPTFWVLAGYLLYGQFPVAYNLLFDPAAYHGFTSVPLMVLLVLTGYRALLLGIVTTVTPSRAYVTRPSLPIVSWMVPLALITVGALARLLVRNNLTGGAVAWHWSFSFAFTCTPVGVCLVIAMLSNDRTPRSPQIYHRWLATLLLIVGAASALVDISRKDAGVTLLPILLFGLFRIRPHYPRLELTGRRAIILASALAGLGVFLMLVRAYSWVRDNNTDLATEVTTSIHERRANDVTNNLTFVLDTTPSQYDYLYGRTFGSLLPVPRSLWPARPPAHSYIVGLQWKHIPITYFDDAYWGPSQLTISAHLLGEGYANFSWLGALGIEVFLGALIGAYESALAAGRLVTLRILYPAILFFILTQQRGDVAMMNALWISAAGMLWGCLVVFRAFSGKTVHCGTPRIAPPSLTYKPRQCSYNAHRAGAET